MNDNNFDKLNEKLNRFGYTLTPDLVIVRCGKRVASCEDVLQVWSFIADLENE